MSWDRVDWTALERMRRAFLDGSAGRGDYWHDARDLESYDATFAQRIGWKWDHVIADLERLGWAPPAGELADWGCGSGIAHRAWLDHFGCDQTSALWVSDRSPLAAKFAAAKAQAKYPRLTVQTGVPDSPAVLLLSHVLTELELPAIDHLVKRAEQATCIVWVEPGTYAASRALIGVREHLRDRFEVVSPCTHQAACGMLAPGNERHWCHHFAKPPAYVFTDSDWGRFARLLEIDLRSVPLSYLVLDRRPAPLRLRELSRVIGRPRVYKPEARVHLCNAQGIGDFRLTRRDLPEEFRRMKKGEVDTLVQARADGDRLTEFSPWAGDQS